MGHCGLPELRSGSSYSNISCLLRGWVHGFKDDSYLASSAGLCQSWWILSGRPWGDGDAESSIEDAPSSRPAFIVSWLSYWIKFMMSLIIFDVIRPCL